MAKINRSALMPFSAAQMYDIVIQWKNFLNFYPGVQAVKC